MDPLEKLALVNGNGKGALCYGKEDHSIFGYMDPDIMSEMCDRIIHDGPPDGMDDIFHQLSSTGGARPKMYMDIDDAQWIVKLRERTDPPYMGRMEYEYNSAAAECGIDVSEHRLLPSKDCGGYFASRRFDREGEKRIHMIPLSGSLEVPHYIPALDYLTFLQATMYMTQSRTEMLKAFRLACFNILAGNCDDHSKNLSYLYSEKKGGYVLSPAYDLSRTTDMKEHEMTCMGNGVPGKDDLIALAKRIGIHKKEYEDIIGRTEDVIDKRLHEWIGPGRSV